MSRLEFVRAIVEDVEHPGELLLDLGEDLCKYLDWHPGDEIDWKDNGDGTWTLTKHKTALPAE
jgi:hypothetical protein